MISEKTDRIYSALHLVRLADHLVSQATLRGSTRFVNRWQSCFGGRGGLSDSEMERLEVSSK